MKKISMISGFIATLLTMSCQQQTENTVAATPSIPVETAQVGGASNNNVTTASGKIEAVSSAQLSTRMMGYVTRVSVKMGQRVTKGQLLVSINNTDIQAKKAQTDAGVLQATTALKNAQKDYDRFKNLFDQQSATQKELDDMTARLSMAQATLEGAKQLRNEVLAQMAYVNVTAPFSGVITGTFVKEGDMANPGMPLVSLEGGTQWQAVAMVPESSISSIKNGMKAQVVVKSIGKTLSGKVTEVSASAQNTGGQYLVKVNLDHPDAAVLSGMFVRVNFEGSSSVATNNGMITVNSEALVRQGQLTGLYTLTEDHKALLRWVRTGRVIGNQTEILSGIKTGETYVVSADGKLYNGATVQP